VSNGRGGPLLAAAGVQGALYSGSLFKAQSTAADRPVVVLLRPGPIEDRRLPNTFPQRIILRHNLACVAELPSMGSRRRAARAADRARLSLRSRRPGRSAPLTLPALPLTNVRVDELTGHALHGLETIIAGSGRSTWCRSWAVSRLPSRPLTGTHEPRHTATSRDPLRTLLRCLATVITAVRRAAPVVRRCGPQQPTHEAALRGRSPSLSSVAAIARYEAPALRHCTSCAGGGEKSNEQSYAKSGANRKPHSK
jgi:hypothetical protein